MNLSELYQIGRDIAAAAQRAMSPPAGTDFDLGSGETVLLGSLLERPDGATITELTAASNLAQSRVSSLVDRLRSLGLVTAEPDPADRRRTVVRLLPEVREAIEMVLGRSADPALAELLGDLEESEKTMVADALNVLRRQLLGHGRTLPPPT